MLFRLFAQLAHAQSPVIFFTIDDSIFTMPATLIIRHYATRHCHFSFTTSPPLLSLFIVVVISLSLSLCRLRRLSMSLPYIITPAPFRCRIGISVTFIFICRCLSRCHALFALFSRRHFHFISIFHYRRYGLLLDSAFAGARSLLLRRRAMTHI